jgi:hypothetical protein
MALAYDPVKEWQRKYDEKLGLRAFVTVKLHLSEDRQRAEEVFVDILYPTIRFVPNRLGGIERSEFVPTPIRERKRTRYWGDAGWPLNGPGINLSELKCVRPPVRVDSGLGGPPFSGEDVGGLSKAKAIWLTIEPGLERKSIRGRLQTRVVDRPGRVEEVASWTAEPWSAADAEVEREVTEQRKQFQK